jgi:hypothetical protein
MITMRLDADTYLRWLEELGDLWFQKGREPSIVRRRNSGVWRVERNAAA